MRQGWLGLSHCGALVVGDMKSLTKPARRLLSLCDNTMTNAKVFAVGFNVMVPPGVTVGGTGM